MKKLGQILIFLTSLGILGAIAFVALMAGVIYKYGQPFPFFKNFGD